MSVVSFKEFVIAEAKDACYHKVKSRYKIFPSAYASGALVKCRKAGADNWGNKSEESASGDSSLHDWFTKSKSSDGKPGWVQLGGKYAGKPCAKQPGQTTKPKCGSSKMKRELSAKQEKSAFLRKNRQDPNPERTGAPINVATEKKKKIEECWKGYRKDPNDPMKMKGGRQVPNCVPVSEARIPLHGHPYHKKSEAELRYIRKDAGEAARAMKGHNPRAEAKYLDQINDAETVLHYRSKGGKRVVEEAVRQMDESPANLPIHLAINHSDREARQHARGWRDANKEMNRSVRGSGPSNQRADEYAHHATRAEQHAREYKKRLAELETGRKKNEDINEASAAWQRKEGKNPEGGLNRKGVESYRRENPGSKLQMAVTTKPSKLKPGSKAAKRRKSFCARMGGMPGPMKDEKGRPTRKALSLRKWNC